WASACPAGDSRSTELKMVSRSSSRSDTSMSQHTLRQELPGSRTADHAHTLSLSLSLSFSLSRTNTLTSHLHKHTQTVSLSLSLSLSPSLPPLLPAISV